jgi:MPBQ/MSBQ methyltransferase
MPAPLEGLCSPTEAWLFYFGWSRIYDAMQPFFTSPEMREAGLDLAELHTEGGAATLDVLDMGAGTGTLSQQVVQRGVKKLTLLDQSAQMLDQARAKPLLAECSFVLADASQPLPFDDDSFDRIVSSGFFYYMPNPVEALREQMRVTRVGGRVLVMGSLAPKPLLVRLLAQTFNRFPTTEQYEGWFRDAGLSDVSYKYVSNPWNAQQYAIAIVGIKAPGTAQPARLAPRSDAPLSRLRRLAYLPLACARFGVALAAFAFIGPLQVATAAMGMRRMRLKA